MFSNTHNALPGQLAKNAAESFIFIFLVLTSSSSSNSGSACATLPDVDQAVTIGVDSADNPVCIADDQRRQGTYVVGLQGMGKSTLLLNMVLQDLEAGKGVCLIDPHRDLVQDVLARAALPPENVVLLDPGNYQHPFGLNLFACDDPNDPSAKERAKSYVMDIFKKLWGPDGVTPSWGPQLESILNHLTQVFVEAQGYTLIDIPHFLLDDDFRSHVLQQVSYKSRRYWQQTYDKRKDKLNYITPTLNRVTRFTDHEILSYILGQSRSTINFSEIMDQGKVVMVRLTEGHIGKEGVTLLGSLITGQILQAMMRRIDQDRLLRRPFAIYCDEFQLVATTDFPLFFTQGRKFGLQTLVAHQARYQLDKVSRDATAAVSNRIGFRLSPPDASALSDWFEPTAMMQDAVITSDPIRFLIDHGHPNAKIRHSINRLYKTGYAYAQEYQKEFANPDPKTALEMYNLQRTGKWNLLQQRRLKTYFWSQAIKSLNLYLYIGMSHRSSHASETDFQLFQKAANDLICALADPPALPRPPADPWSLPRDLRPSKYQQPFMPSMTRQLNYENTVDQTQQLLAYQRSVFEWAVQEYQQSMTYLVHSVQPIVSAVYSGTQVPAVDPNLTAVIRSILFLRMELAKDPLTEVPYQERQYDRARKARDPESVLKTLPEYQALATFGRGSAVAQVTLKTLPPKPALPDQVAAAQLQAINAYAREHYTRPRQEVAREIQARQRVSSQQPKLKITRTV